MDGNLPYIAYMDPMGNDICGQNGDVWVWNIVENDAGGYQQPLKKRWYNLIYNVSKLGVPENGRFTLQLMGI